jgi:hypothetical protein
MTGHPTTTATVSDPTICPDLAEQIHALSQAAALLRAAGLPGLALTFDADRIGIQVGRELGDEPTRAAMVTRLATVAGTRARRWGGTGPTAGWIIADGHLAGHPLHIFTAIGDRP